jgi:hypothetical protein
MATLFDHLGDQCWFDLEPHSLYKPPYVMITAEEMATYNEAWEEHDVFRRPRRMIFRDPDTGYKYRLNLTFFQMPTGASAVTLATAGVSQVEGHGLSELGVLSVATDNIMLFAGMFLPKYYSLGADTFHGVASTTFVQASLTEGDGIWLVRSGQYEAYNLNGGSASDGNLLVPGVTGHFDWTAGTFSVPPTAAELQPWLGKFFFGYWRATVLTTAVGRADFRLPERWIAP